MSALSHKAKENAIVVFEDITLDAPKTKQIADAMKALKIGEKKTLLVMAEYNDNLYLSTRNVPNIASSLLADVNTYDIVNADVLILTENAAKIFTEEEATVEA